ncbi:MAG: class I SAM-dependent methyltransferase [Phycisphaerae bacterium]|jgi:SAM-dependent methyltransferase
MSVTTTSRPRLKLLPRSAYRGVNQADPIRFYYWPVLGGMYRRRVELCLGECTGGKRVLEVGFGTGLTFLNLRERYEEIHGLDLTADVEEIRTLFAGHGIPTHLANGDVTQMPYADGTFDTVLLISILEHLRPEQQDAAFTEIRRVLRPGGQVVYGVPVERLFMVVAFRCLGCNIREHHFSTEQDVRAAAGRHFDEVRVIPMYSTPPIFGQVYEVGHFRKGQ